MLPISIDTIHDSWLRGIDQNEEIERQQEQAIWFNLGQPLLGEIDLPKKVQSEAKGKTEIVYSKVKRASLGNKYELPCV